MKVFWDGKPGEAFKNDTTQILYQFICSLSNTCGACFQYHLKIAKWWPRLHRGCNCRSEPVYPGAKARAYEDYRVILDSMPPDQQKAAVGASCWRLIESGVVKWDDVVTSSRVRLLREVVSLKNLDVATMVKAGVKPDVARQAHATVNTAAHQHAKAHQAQLVQSILAMGVSPSSLQSGFGAAMTRRIGIGAGPSGPMGFAVRIPSPVFPGGGGGATKRRAAMKPGPASPSGMTVPRPEEGEEPEKWRKQLAGYIALHNIAVERDGYEAIAQAEGKKWAEKIVASFDPRNGKIYLNQRHPFWRNPVAVMRGRKQFGLSSTANPAHPAFQEIAHRLHQKAVGLKRYRELRGASLTSEQDAVAVKISQAARVSPVEYVAEVFAMMKDGQAVAPEVMKLYNHFGGPTP